MKITKVLFYVFLQCSCLFGQSQGLSKYNGLDGSYVIQIPQGLIHQQKDLPNGIVDVFISADQKGLKYAVTISQMATENTYRDLFTSEFKEQYAAGCGCELSGDLEREFRAYKGLYQNMSKLENGQIFKGVTVNTVASAKLYNLTLFTHADKLEIYSSEFNAILESFDPY